MDVIRPAQMPVDEPWKNSFAYLALIPSMICVFTTYFELGIDQELVEQAPIIAVDSRAEEADEAGEVEEE